MTNEAMLDWLKGYRDHLDEWEWAGVHDSTLLPIVNDVCKLIGDIDRTIQMLEDLEEA